MFKRHLEKHQKMGPKKGIFKDKRQESFKTGRFLIAFLRENN